MNELVKINPAEDGGDSLVERVVTRLEGMMARRMTVQVQPMELRTFADLAAWADRAADSDLVPKDYRGKPNNIVLAVQWGSEIGLRPMQSLMNIAIIGGRPAVWGDALLALCKSHPAYVSTEETIEGAGDARVAICTMVRRGEPPITRRFSVDDAKKASLWGKDIWSKYPERMLQMRARGFAARDAFPDKLRGLIGAEEAGDYEPEVIRARPVHSQPRPDTAPLIGRDAINAEVPVREYPAEPVAAPPRPSTRQWLIDLEAAVEAATDPSTLDAIRTRADVSVAPKKLTNGALDRFNAIMQDLFNRLEYGDDNVAEPPPAPPPTTNAMAAMRDAAADERGTRFNPPPAKATWPKDDEHLPASAPGRFGPQTTLEHDLDDEIPF